MQEFFFLEMMICQRLRLRPDLETVISRISYTIPNLMFLMVGPYFSEWLNKWVEKPMLRK